MLIRQRRLFGQRDDCETDPQMRAGVSGVVAVGWYVITRTFNLYFRALSTFTFFILLYYVHFHRRVRRRM